MRDEKVRRQYQHFLKGKIDWFYRNIFFCHFNISTISVNHSVCAYVSPVWIFADSLGERRFRGREWQSPTRLDWPHPGSQKHPRTKSRGRFGFTWRTGEPMHHQLCLKRSHHMPTSEHIVGSYTNISLFLCFAKDFLSSAAGNPDGRGIKCMVLQRTCPMVRYTHDRYSNPRRER